MISVVIPTFNREECLYKMLQSLSNQKYKDFEILVIDQSETAPENKIASILNSCENIRYFLINRKGRCLSKNFAIDKAIGDVILFCDDDIIADENFLAEHARIHLEMPEVGALSCHLIEPHESEINCSMPLKITWFGRFVNKPNAVYNGYVTSLNGGNMSFKKQALNEIGYFDENLWGTSMLEEPDMAFRLSKAGYKIYFSSHSRVRHYPQRNGNIGTRNANRYQWQKDYYFNQYFFMFRNKRTKYLPAILFYLVYRTLVESMKGGTISFKYLFLPVSALKSASQSWREKKEGYLNISYTPKTNGTEVLKYKSTENALVPQKKGSFVYSNLEP